MSSKGSTEKAIVQYSSYAMAAAIPAALALGSPFDTCAYLCAYPRVCASLFVCVYVCLFVCLSACVSVCMYVSVVSVSMHACECVRSTGMCV